MDSCDGRKAVVSGGVERVAYPWGSLPNATTTVPQ